MQILLNIDQMTADQNERLSRAIEREGKRLRSFIRKRIADEGLVEDILQDVFSELIEAYRMMKPIEQISAWLFQVARNRITDLFRKRKPQPLADPMEFPGGERPEIAYLQNLLWEELDLALGELPEEQRDIFIAHQFEGRSFKELAAETGVSVNTLISRKHYAVLHLRRRLQAIYDQFREG